MFYSSSAYPRMERLTSRSSIEMTGRPRNSKCELERLIVPECLSTDVDIVIQSVALEEACLQTGLVRELETADFRTDVVAGLNQKWKDYV